ncbi:hypothetical protein ACEUZ9_002964 [Paracoccus litorisediminis]|uniref:hypothetical protein n=1 Tax=Paracoccus litorisediminis TaxID=2006130 RepID=UPI00372FB23D
MGVRIQIPGITVANPVAFNPPVARGLEGLFLLTGTDPAIVRKNLALDPADPDYLAAVMGSPAFTATGVVCTNLSAYLDTRVADSAIGTTLVIARNEDPPSSFIAPYAACWADDTSDAYTGQVGASIMQRLPGTSPAGTVAGTIAIVNASNPTAATVGRSDMAVADVTAWHAYAAGYDGANRWAWDLTSNGATKVSAATTAKISNSQATWLLGSAAGGIPNSGRSRIAAFVRHSVALTDTEVAAWITFFRSHPRMAALGTF